jgi:uncharacterized protein (TIGR02145 family)
MKFISTILLAVVVCIALCACRKTASTNNGPVFGTLTDLDGNTYRTIRLGNQEWTMDNYRCTHYNNKPAIAHITDSASRSNATAGAYCFYNNTTNADTIQNFGALYNGYAIANIYFPPLGGWRVPTQVDFDTLLATVERMYNVGNDYVGQLLKSPHFWMQDPDSTTLDRNLTNFSMLPTGERIGKDQGEIVGFGDVGFRGYLWVLPYTDTVFGSSYGGSGASLTSPVFIDISDGFAVRLV